MSGMISGWTRLGRDQQIGAMISEGRIDVVLFLRDPLTAQPHEPDIAALIRVCDFHKVPLATNARSAHLLLDGMFGGGGTAVLNAS